MSAGLMLIGIGEPTPLVAVPTNQASADLVLGPGAASALVAPDPTSIASASPARTNGLNRCTQFPPHGLVPRTAKSRSLEVSAHRSRMAHVWQPRTGIVGGE